MCVKITSKKILLNIGNCLEGLNPTGISSTRTMLIMKSKIRKKFSLYTNYVVKINFIL